MDSGPRRGGPANRWQLQRGPWTAQPLVVSNRESRGKQPSFIFVPVCNPSLFLTASTSLLPNLTTLTITWKCGHPHSNASQQLRSNKQDPYRYGQQKLDRRFGEGGKGSSQVRFEFTSCWLRGVRFKSVAPALLIHCDSTSNSFWVRFKFAPFTFRSNFDSISKSLQSRVEFSSFLFSWLICFSKMQSIA